MHRLEPGQPIQLADFATSGKEFRTDREVVEDDFIRLREEIIDRQNCFYADGRRRLLIILQAMDAGGKDGTIRKVFRGVNPQGVRVTSFKQPSANELSHGFLWRVHQAVPAKGMIGVFNRSHYEDVLVARVDQLVPEEVWRERYEQINQFEKMLVQCDTTILKFYLHISYDEQRERLQARVTDPRKNWKFSPDDLRKRTQWDQYHDAYQEMLNRCTTDWAPWYVIPADQKWYRNFAIARVISSTLRDMDLKYPAPEIPPDLRIE